VDVRRIDDAVFFEAGLRPGALEALKVVHGFSEKFAQAPIRR
jgi:hypothetical protein